MQPVTNFGRFYAAFRKLPNIEDPEEIKRMLVSQYTSRRTDSLRKMTRKEYNALCTALEEINGAREELRRRRSIVLKLMQELNVDTTDWTRVNRFCGDPRIAGKPFSWLTIDELAVLARKLRAIKDKRDKKSKEANYY